MRRDSLAYLAGAVTQGALLGLLLFFAVGQLLVASGGITIFKYQGF